MDEVSVTYGVLAKRGSRQSYTPSLESGVSGLELARQVALDRTLDLANGGPGEAAGYLQGQGANKDPRRRLGRWPPAGYRDTPTCDEAAR